MKTEQQVTSLEPSKRLKELGVKQESLYRWSVKGKHFCADEEVPEATPFLTQEKPPYDFPYKEIAPAFTVAELGEMLPKTVDCGPYIADLQIIRSSVWRFYYGDPQEKHSIKFTAYSDDTEADARARFLIFLLENGLIKKEHGA